MMRLLFQSLSLIIAGISAIGSVKQLHIYVNNIAPLSNPSETYRYYILPFIQPKDEIKSDQSFSQSLSGDRLYNSPYVSIFGRNSSEVDTRLSIGSKNFTHGELQEFKLAIDNQFYAEFYIEEFIVHDMIGEKIEDNQGKELHYLKTHIDFNVFLNENDKEEVLFANITNNYGEDSNSKSSVYTLIDVETIQTLEIEFTYTVNYFYTQPEQINFDKDPVFDKFDYGATQTEEQPQVHIIAIVLSFCLVGLLVVFVYLVLSRILKRDFVTSADIENDSSVEIGWKLIRTEALMPPKHKSLLSSYLGNGLQFIFLTINIVCLGTLGLYYKTQKGNLKQIGVFLYSFTGLFNGYYSAKYYKFFGGKHWALNFIASATLFPVSLLTVFTIVNSYAWYKGSTSAIPAEAIFLVLLILFVIFLPLTLVGTIISRIKTIDILPSADSALPRLYKPIPDRKVHETAIFHFILGGLIPFSSIYLELHQIFNSVWGHTNYHLYGFLVIAFILFLAVQACVSIVLTYLQLNSMDYNWWWRSFSYGGSTSLFIATYVVYYYYSVSPMNGTLQFMMYFGYMVLACMVSFLMLGSVSFLASMKFVRYIYANAKID